MEPSIERAGARERRARANAQRGEYRQSERQDDGKRGPRGYDAGKKVKGRKRTILVDTLGLLLKVVVHEADVQDRDGAIWLLLAMTGLGSALATSMTLMRAGASSAAMVNVQLDGDGASTISGVLGDPP